MKGLVKFCYYITVYKWFYFGSKNMIKQKNYEHRYNIEYVYKK